MNAPNSPYRSKKRDTPRVIVPTWGEDLQALLEGTPRPGAKLAPDEILLKEDGPRLSQMLQKAEAFNRGELGRLNEKEFRDLLNCLDDLWTIMSRYIWAIYSLSDARPHPAQDVLFPCLWKSILSLYACHILTARGLFGVARPHLRHVFESLIVAKFCCVNPASDVYDRWVDGVDIYFTNAILKKIARPSTEEFSQLWKMLCRWSHATVFAVQGGMDLKETREGTMVNIGLSEVFVQWAYHLLSSHMLTPTVRYYGNRYATTSKADKARARLKASFAHNKEYLGEGSLRLIRDFRASWKLR